MYHLFLTMASPFLTYNIVVDALFMSPLLVLLLYSIYTTHVEMHAGMIIIGLAVIALSLITPIRAGDEYWVSRRFPLMAVLLLSASILPEPFEKRSTTIAVTAGVLSIVVARAVWIDQVWQSRQRDVQSVESAISHVPRGAVVFCPIGASRCQQGTCRTLPKRDTEGPLGDDNAVYSSSGGPAKNGVHADALFGSRPAASENFTALDRLTPVLSAVPDMHVLDRALTPEVLQRDPYLRDWQKWFDYVIIIGMDHEDYQGPFVPPDQLRLVSDNGYARLYRVGEMTR